MAGYVYAPVRWSASPKQAKHLQDIQTNLLIDVALGTVNRHFERLDIAFGSLNGSTGPYIVTITGSTETSVTAYPWAGCPFSYQHRQIPVVT